MRPLSPHYRLACVALFAVCSHSVHAGWFDSCRDASRGAKPAWVQNGGVGSDQEWVIGYGSAPLGSGGDSANRRDAALADARTDLARSIVVSVQSREQVSEQAAGNHSDFQYQSETITATDLRVGSVEPFESWIDPKSCTQHMLVRIPRAAADSLMRHETAERLFREASEADKGHRQRHQRIQEVLRLSQLIRYDLLPDRLDQEHYLQRYQQLADQLQREHDQQRHAVALLIQQDARQLIPETAQQRLQQQIAQRLPGGFASNVQCATLIACKQQLKDSAAEVITIAEVTVILNKRFGIWEAELSSGLHSFTSADRERLYQTPRPLSAKVIARQQHKIDWEQAVDKLLSTNDQTFTDLLNACQPCQRPE